ncbi:MAG: glycoside hydrolase family 16 protein [Alteraurantiacibacter sp.]
MELKSTFSALVTAMIALSACGGDSGDRPVAGPGPAPAPTTAAGEWELVWAEEFHGDTLDTSRWNTIADCWGGGNEERQCYTARVDNVALDDGMLVLTARDEDYTGNAWPAHIAPSRPDPDEKKTGSFTSGKITTAGKASWLYGRFEMRARLPQGQGTWPAFWMLPEEELYGGWPLSGEIDIMETVNLGVECASCEAGGENTVVGTLHYGNRPPGNRYKGHDVSFPGVLDGDFHTYGVIWEKGRFTWTVDGEPYGTLTRADWFTAASRDPDAPFDRPFHLILNLAIGGNWPENTNAGGVSEDGFPKRMEVDWVRVWQCDADRATGRGCQGN